MSRAQAERSGRRGETLAAWCLRLKGYRILAKRQRTVRGEVDLVARRRKTIVFVEVKTRARQKNSILPSTNADWRGSRRRRRYSPPNMRGAARIFASM
jgi:Holliday junction resolvase-like predicted endonuclease